MLFIIVFVPSSRRGPALCSGAVEGVGGPYNVEGALAWAQLLIYSYKYLSKESLCENPHKTILYYLLSFM